MPSEPQTSAERQQREERAERIRAAYRNDPKIINMLKRSQEDERAGRFTTWEELQQKYAAE